MRCKEFYATFGRFPTQQEFRQLRESTLRNDLRFPANQYNSLTSDDYFVDAARLGDIKKLEELLPQISSIDCSSRIVSADQEKEPMCRPTALCMAAQANQIEAVKWLLDHGAKVDIRSHGNRTALLYAAESGHFDCMNLLIRNGATHFTYTDQQVESHFVSYTIRQSITRRELSHVIPSEEAAGLVLDYLGLGGQRVKLIDRLASKPAHEEKNIKGDGRPSDIISPIADPPPLAMPSFAPIRVTKHRDPSLTPSTVRSDASSRAGDVSMPREVSNVMGGVQMQGGVPVQGMGMVPNGMVPPAGVVQMPVGMTMGGEEQYMYNQQYAMGPGGAPMQQTQQGVMVSVPVVPVGGAQQVMPGQPGRGVAAGVPPVQYQYGLAQGFVMGPTGPVYVTSGPPVMPQQVQMGMGTGAVMGGQMSMPMQNQYMPQQ